MFPILIPLSSQMSFCAIFLSFFGWQYLHSWVHLQYLLLDYQAGMADLFLYFQIKCSSFLCGNSLFGVYLANSECDAYLAVDHGLVYLL